LFPKPSKVQKVKHHTALPFPETGGFIKELRKQQGMAALALEFTILTACRTGETIGATWDEIDLEEKVWTIPAERMKAEKEHRIPLSDRAIKVVKATTIDERTGYVFPGPKAGKPLSNMAMLALLGRMKRDDLTVHGFRSTFRDWAGETTAFPREVIEHALAHLLKDKAEASYARGTLFDKRRLLMDHWATFCATTRRENNVVGIMSKATA
jgi:integrase